MKLGNIWNFKPKYTISDILLSTIKRIAEIVVELIHESRNAPTIRENPNKKETLYRFAGLIAEKELFFVQVKEERKREGATNILVPISNLMSCCKSENFERKP